MRTSIIKRNMSENTDFIHFPPKDIFEYHIPVLLNESIAALNIQEGSIIIDATLGGGGHTAAILEQNSSVVVLAFDKDSAAIDHVIEFRHQYPERLILINDNFSNLRTRISLEKIKKIDGIIYDLGVSYNQISGARGFSYTHDGRLDMRMSVSEKLTASDIINEFSYEKLRSIFFEYGEERESVRIAKAIIRERQKKEIKTTLELSAIIENNTVSRKKLKAKARIFQALRIFINNELEVLKTSLREAVDVLNPGGRIVVISYHSIEDRIIKKFFQHEEKSCICSSQIPICQCDKVSTLKIITKKPIIPSENETTSNRMARSAKMRIAEKRGNLQ